MERPMTTSDMADIEATFTKTRTLLLLMMMMIIMLGRPLTGTATTASVVRSKRSKKK